MFKKLKSFIPKGEFAKNVLTLMTGTTIAQAIPIAISPILTRIYTPEDFGVLALFMAITAITGTIANAKYELAIVLPKKEEESINVLTLGIIITTIFSLVLLIIVILFNTKITELLKEPEIKNWLYFIPISTFFLGIYNSLNFFNVRNKKFKNISISRVTKSSSLGIIQVFVGLIQTGPFGLVIGQITSYFSGNFILFKALKEKKWLISHISKIEMKRLGKKYKKFPTFSTPSIFINSINLNLVSLLITSLFSISTLGFYSLTQRIIGIPSKVIGSSFSQVYFQKATEEYQATGKTKIIFIKTLKKLFLISLPIFIILFLISEPLFTFAFGEEWKIAGLYAKILVPLAFIRFISSSLSITIGIHLKQQIGLYFNILLLITILSIFYYTKTNSINFITLLTYLSFTLTIEYILLLLICYQISKS